MSVVLNIAVILAVLAFLVKSSDIIARIEDEGVALNATTVISLLLFTSAAYVSEFIPWFWNMTAFSILIAGIYAFFTARKWYRNRSH